MQSIEVLHCKSLTFKNYDDSFDNFYLISRFRAFLNKETRKRMKKWEGQQDWTRKSERWDWRWKICPRVCWRKIPVCDHFTLSHTRKFSSKCLDLIQIVHICAFLYLMSFWLVSSRVPSVIVEQDKCCRGHCVSVKSWNICLQQFGKHPLLPTLKLLSRDFDKIET